MGDKKVTFKIDGREVQADPSETVLPVALRYGIEIPHYCYHPALSIVAQCRLCLVEVEGIPRLQAACSTPIRDGMVVKVHTSQSAAKARNEMLELLLANHPLDCPICDKGGECDLQDFTMRYGPTHSRYEEPKRRMSDLDLGREVLNRNRCVVCTRCIRVSSEIAGQEELTLAKRGNNTYVSPTPGQSVSNLLSGNMADVCPVGAITTKDFRFRARVWDLAKTESVCGLCSRGCNITAWHKQDRLFRITPRFNPRINAYWMCDIGRFEYNYQSDPKRLAALQGNGAAGSWDTAVRKAAELLSGAANRRRKIGILATTFLTQEEAVLLKELRDRFLPGAALTLVAPQGEEIRYKSFWISGDRGPNRRGLEAIFDQKVGDSGKALGSCDALFLINSGPKDPFELAGLTPADLGKIETVIVQDVLERPLSKQATLLLPAAVPYETTGTWVNVEGTQQTFEKAVEPPGAAKAGWWILARVLHALGHEKDFKRIEAVRSFGATVHLDAKTPVGRRPWQSRYTYDLWGTPSDER